MFWSIGVTVTNVLRKMFWSIGVTVTNVLRKMSFTKYPWMLPLNSKSCPLENVPIRWHLMENLNLWQDDFFKRKKVSKKFDTYSYLTFTAIHFNESLDHYTRIYSNKSRNTISNGVNPAISLYDFLFPYTFSLSLNLVELCYHMVFLHCCDFTLSYSLFSRTISF